MFTGLIESIGKFVYLKRNENGYTLKVENEIKYEDLRVGQSICVNGCCLTVEMFENRFIYFFVSNETYSTSNFKYLFNGSFVNLERALKVTDRLDGHIVSGHVESLAKLIKIENDQVFTFRLCDEKYKRYMINKGSIALNGVSLTIYNLENLDFSISLINLTLDKTNIKFLKIGDFVNVETDIFGKYVENMICLGNNSCVDMAMLKDNGFV